MKTAESMMIASLDAETVAAALERLDLPADVRRVLELRQLTASASVKKIYAMDHQASRDNRLRDLIVHHGTHPGRPTGGGVQPLNLPKSGPKLVWCETCKRPHRPMPLCPWCNSLGRADRRASWSVDMVPFVLEIMATRSLTMVERFFGDAQLVISGCVRSLFIAAPGHDLIGTDYSSLQAVVLAMLAGEQWRIDAFRKKEPLYLLGASKITGMPLQFYLDYHAQHGEHHSDRQKIGKVSELACFGAKTEVLTDKGYVPIKDVRKSDRLWDGVEWVGHEGVILQGHRSVIQLDGVPITPDHLVNTNGFWRPASILGLDGNILSQALATGSASLPCGPMIRHRGTMALRSNATVAAILFKSAGAVFEKVWLIAARYVPPIVIRNRRSTIGGMQISFPTMRTAAGFSTGFRLVSPDASQMGTQIMAAGESAFSDRGVTELKAVALSYPILSVLKAGITPLWNWIARKWMATMRPAIFGLPPNEQTPKINGRSKPCSASSTPLEPVYDIAHAGPRNRFTIRSASGHLLVHNCGFQGWINSYRAFGSDEADDVIRSQILAWRAASPAIVEFWGGQWRGPPWCRERSEYYGMEGTFIRALQSPGVTFTFRGMPFLYDQNRDALTIGLLSGLRALTYWHPRLTQSDRNADELSISYSGWNTNPNRGSPGWQRMSTYGGSLTENVVMAHEVEIQRYGQLALRAAGFSLVLEVYDENVVEVPEGVGSIEEIERIMSEMPPWAHDWPVVAEGGWRGKRYRKG